MKFPPTNKMHKKFNERFGENAKLLEEHLTKLNWKIWARAYAIFFGIFLVSLFLIIAVVQLALKI